MGDTSLSRWTVSYFASALVSLLVAEGLMVAGFGFPSHPIEAPETLVVVHLVAIGWLSLLMCGALIQFVPVLVAAPLAHPELPGVALLLLLAGLTALIAGFFGIAGLPVGGLFWLPLGAIGLAAGFALNIWNLARTLQSARPLGLPARFVAVGLASLVGVIALGTIFALVLGGWTTRDPFVALTSEAIPLHAILGLAGWLTFTAIGVSYRLLAMFMLAPETEHATSRVAFVAGAAALFAVMIGGPLCLLVAGRTPTHVLAIAGLGAAVCLSCYGVDVVRLYRARKRRKLELNARVAAWALGGLGVSSVLLLAVTVAGGDAPHIGALVFFFAFAWLTGLGLAKLYKIVAFLTWLECYGAVLGKRPTPRVQDLVDEARALPWFRLYFASVVAASLAAFFNVPIAFRLAAVGMLMATCRLGLELWRTRTLKLVPAALLPPQGRPRHPLLPILQDARP